MPTKPEDPLEPEDFRDVVAETIRECARLGIEHGEQMTPEEAEILRQKLADRETWRRAMKK